LDAPNGNGFVFIATPLDQKQSFGTAGWTVLDIFTKGMICVRADVNHPILLLKDFPASSRHQSSKSHGASKKIEKYLDLDMN